MGMEDTTQAAEAASEVGQTSPAGALSGASVVGASVRLGERVRSLRVAAGLTQTELAGGRFSKEYISQIERGKTRPTESTIAWLAERLSVDPAFLAVGVSTEERTKVAMAERDLSLNLSEDDALKKLEEQLT